MSIKALFAAVTMVAMMLVVPGLASAAGLQGAETKGEIAGAVLDTDGGALPGATVTLTGDLLIQDLISTTTNAQGRYRFRNLRIGVYTVTASLSGFQAMAYSAQVNALATSTVDAELAIAGVEENILVTSETPMIQQAETTMSTAIGEDLIQNVPVARSFVEVTEFATGISDRGAYGAGGGHSEGTTTVSAHRIGSAANMYKLNGVDVTEPDWGNTWVNPSIDTLAEVQVVAYGASAEEGNYTGASINLITKGGTNEFHGSGSYYFQNGDLRGDNSGGIVDLTRGKYKHDHEGTVALGGPLVRNKLLFFANASRKSVSASTVSQEVADATNFTDSLDLFQETNKVWRLHGRMDFLLNDRNTFGAMINHDPGAQGNILLSPGEQPEVSNDTTYGATTWLISWQSQPGDNTYIDLRYAGYEGDFQSTPKVLGLPGLTLGGRGIDVQTSGTEEHEFNGRDDIRGSVTQYVDDFLGAAHDLKVGFVYNDTFAVWDNNYTGAESTLCNSAETVGCQGNLWWYPSYGEFGYVYGYLYNSHVHEIVRMPGGFIQNDITVSDRLNLNMGIRLDAPQVSDWYLNGGIGSDRFPEFTQNDNAVLGRYNNWGPRLGASFDVSGDGKVVAHASWGRYFEKINAWGLVGFAENSHQAICNCNTAYDASAGYLGYLQEPFAGFDANAEGSFEGFDPTPEQVAAVFDAIIHEDNFAGASVYGTAYPLDPNLNTLKADVFNAGVEFEIARNWVVGVEYIRKRDNQFIIWNDREPRDWSTVFSNVQSPVVPGFIDTPTSQPVYQCANCVGSANAVDSDWFITNNDHYGRQHDIATLTLEKRAARNFNFNVSLVYTDSRGTITNRDHALWGRDSTNDEHDNPNYVGHPFRDHGPLDYSRKWYGKALANYRLPGGILASAFWQVSTGRPWNITTRRRDIERDNGISFQDTRIGSIFVEPWGSRTWQMMNRIDLRFQKTFDVGRNRLELIADVFNITNDDQPVVIRFRTDQKYPVSGLSSVGKARNSGAIRAPRQARFGARFIF